MVAEPEDVEVRHVHPFQATKRYICPGCGHDVEPGTGHEVVVPRDAPDLRRHWHTPCWAMRHRRRPGR
jgi:ribosomal protein L24E